jgi:hypothetical protein
VGILALAVAGVGPAVALAQAPPDAVVEGTVRDSSGAVAPAVSLTLTGPSLIGGPQTTTSGPHGEFRVIALPAGTYALAAEAAGFEAARFERVRIAAGTTVRLEVRLSPAAPDETVVVFGQQPLIDVTTAATPVRFDRTWLEDLPASRNVADLINLAPGVFHDTAFGGTQLSNAMYVDGVEMTESFVGDPWLRLNRNWVQELQVAGLGATAEYGESTGVIANSTIRSGGNRFSGLGEAWTTRPRWMDRNAAGVEERFKDRFSSEQLTRYWDVSAQVGGPIHRDRVWFFSGYQKLLHDRRPFGALGPGQTETSDDQFITKLTAAATQAVRLEGFVQRGRRLTRAVDFGPYNTIEASADERQPQTSWNARASWVLPAQMLLEVRWGGYDSPYFLDPRPPGTRERPTSYWEITTGLTSGNAYQYVTSARQQHTTAATLTRHGDRFLGRHALKTGVEYENTDGYNTWGTPGGYSVDTRDGVPFGKFYFGPDTQSMAMWRAAWFAQDKWSLGSRVTLEPGVRMDVNRGSAPGQRNIYRTAPLSSRVGIAWNVRNDGRTVVRGHYGRYRDPAFGLRVATEDLSRLNPFRVEYVQPDGTWLEVFNTGAPTDNTAIDPRCGNPTPKSSSPASNTRSRATSCCRCSTSAGASATSQRSSTPAPPGSPSSGVSRAPTGDPEPPTMASG